MAKDREAERLDAALHGLRRSSCVDDKLEALRLLVDYWHGPIRPEDGIPAAELAAFVLPRPLEWWYCWAGRRDDIMSGQNFLYRPAAPTHPYRLRAAEGDNLPFHIENQGCYFWSTRREGDDPPVFGRDSEHEPWVKEKVTLSEHLVLNCISEIVMQAEYRACSVALSELKLDAIVARVPALAIGPWRWCDTSFYAGGGAFMIASPVGEEDDRRIFSVFIGARRDGALDFLAPLLGDEWEIAQF